MKITLRLSYESPGDFESGIQSVPSFTTICAERSDPSRRATKTGRHGQNSVTLRCTDEECGGHIWHSLHPSLDS